MRVRYNILSAQPGVMPPGWREAVTRPTPVPVYSTSLQREVGTADGYQLVGDNLYATADLEDGFPPPPRAAGMLSYDKRTGEVVLRAVVVTDLPREQLLSLMRHFAAPSN